LVVEGGEGGLVDVYLGGNGKGFCRGSEVRTHPLDDGKKKENARAPTAVKGKAGKGNGKKKSRIPTKDSQMWKICEKAHQWGQKTGPEGNTRAPKDRQPFKRTKARISTGGGIQKKPPEV